ncbi:reticulon-like protein B8 [Humulus lupulus]|uniref:reticulon-like protein B8 n=1 Tax=Humulus lupulus TaxID=3486 RepID=UPI002B40D420|nr:reticulon-like protein B8 [Humulus lupulus]XP_062105688.1 reticulon-like protein B8 [Humulus lupulus]
MSEKAENLLNSVAETLAERGSKHKSVSFFTEETSETVSAKFNRLFGRQKPVHHILGGGKSADVLLWRNKKISASVLTGATIIWVIFEWLNYNFLTILSMLLVLGMIFQFIWSNASGLLSRSSSKVPRVKLPKELFVNVAVSVGNEVNRALEFLQDVSCGGNLKQMIVVVLGLWVAAMLGSWCNFLTVLYIGFVVLHTFPVLYEKYDDQIDNFVYQVLEQFQNNYRKLDAGVLSKIPRGSFKIKKDE